VSRLAIPRRDGFQYPIAADVVEFWRGHGGLWMGASVCDRIYHLPGMNLDHGEYYYAVKLPGREICGREVIELAMGGPTTAQAAAHRMERAG